MHGRKHHFFFTALLSKLEKSRTIEIENLDYLHSTYKAVPEGIRGSNAKIIKSLINRMVQEIKINLEK